MFEGICDAIHAEMALLEEKYEKGTQMSEKDLDAIDKMAHALKSLATYEAMKSAGTTRYASRDERSDRGGYGWYRR